MGSNPPTDRQGSDGEQDSDTDEEIAELLDGVESPDEDVQVTFLAERATKDAAKEELGHGEMSELLRGTLREVAFGEEVSERARLEQRLESMRDDVDEKRRLRRQLDAEIESAETEIARLEERYQRKESRDEQYEAKLEMLDELLMDGSHVFPDHGQVIQAARTGGVEPEDVIEELRERNPSCPDEKFRPATELGDGGGWQR